MYAAIVTAVANGIHVVQAGGNGEVNTDLLNWYGNSGAIIVGAGSATSGNDLQRINTAYSGSWGTSYGQRFDLQGWGEKVMTTGYGTYYSAQGPNYYYRADFSGTSSASPCVAGAIACVQGYYVANISATPMSPANMRNLLVNYGTPQVFGPTGNIGPRPDLYQAITNIPPPSNDMDFGDAPDPPYPTLISNNGASHIIDGITFLGYSVDPETNGQPDATATGDDNDGNNDDDGVLFTSTLIPGQNATVQVIASVSGVLNAWIDFNQLNVWGDPGEFIFQNVILAAGVNNLSFAVPPNAVPGNTFARFRFNSTGGLLFYNQYGPAPDGEVEDYMVYIGDPDPYPYDFGDAPDGPYPTLLVNNGARHLIVPGIHMGNSIDSEPDGQPDPNALGDDNDGNNDDDGVVFNTLLIPGQTAHMWVTVSTSGFVNAWFDWNANGNWSDPGEHLLVDAPMVGTNGTTFWIPANAVLGNTFARFRFSTQQGLSFNGQAIDGEVEDYKVLIGDEEPFPLDFGDAPDGPYPTLFASNGARHLIDGVTFLGYTVDPEPDGQPNNNATGDDNDGNNDDDGVLFTSALIPGQNATVQVIASVSGVLNAWIDFNQLNVWGDPGEFIFQNVNLTAGVNSLSFAVPPNATIGNTFARFRFNSTGGLLFYDQSGPAPDGEVEDYQVHIGDDIPDPYDFGDAPEGALAYPASGVIGQFPTCKNVGQPNSWIQHNNFGAFFGPGFDFEPDGNAGFCPLFNPNTYNQDECFMDGDAGLITPGAFTIVGSPGAETVVTCPGSNGIALGPLCTQALWGQNIDIHVQNFMPSMTAGFVNVIIDWDQNGIWGGASICPGGINVPEHVLINFLIPNGFNAPLSMLMPPGFVIGPNTGYVWARFTITEMPVMLPWDGSGAFEDGETEDYLLLVADDIPPPPDFDFGDSPEGALAYPASGVIGQFPTCTNVGPPGSFIQHNNFGAFFGPGFDFEPDGNAGFCPLFNPNTYNQDECFQDGDAGLLVPGAFTIVGNMGAESVVPCPGSPPIPLGNVCTPAIWGGNIDIHVQNLMPGNAVAYVNVLFDWDHSGTWSGFITCTGGQQVPEHALVNHLVPNGFIGPLAATGPLPFTIGNLSGYVWARISITEQPVPSNWDGSGIFEDGETEDYIFLVLPDPNINLQNITVPNGQTTCYEAAQTITTAGSGTTFIVQNGAVVYLVAGQNIIMKDGTHFQSGSYVHAYIDQTGEYCSNPKAIIAEEEPLPEPLPYDFTGKESFFKVYPNPNTGQFTLELNEVKDFSSISVEIFSLVGESVMKVELPGMKQYQFDLSRRQPGIYLIRVMKGADIEVLKLIKQ